MNNQWPMRFCLMPIKKKTVKGKTVKKASSKKKPVEQKVTKKKVTKENSAPKKIPLSDTECAACLTPQTTVGIKGKTAVGKADKLVPFFICEHCHKKVLNAVIGATNITQHRAKFWNRVYANVRKRENHA